MNSTPRNGARKPAVHRLLGLLWTNLVCELTRRDLLAGTAMALVLTAVLVTHKFEAFPSYQVGDIAVSDIRSPQEIPLEDAEATRAKRKQAMDAVPDVFEHDATLPQKVEEGIRDVFRKGRAILQDYSERQNTSLPDQLSTRRHARLWSEVRAALGNELREPLLLIFFQQAFAGTFEDKLVRIYLDAVQPGVVQGRESLRRNPESGITLRRSTGQETLLNDFYALRDVSQARGILRQHQLELSELSALDRREIIGYLEDKVVPNVYFNPVETQNRRQEAARRVEPVQQLIKQGRVIIRQGDEVTPGVLSVIEEIRKRNQPREILSRYVGTFLLMFMLLYAVWRYFVRFQSRHRKIRNHFLLFSLILLISLFLARLFFGLADLLSERLTLVSFKDPGVIYYAIPFVFGCILVTLLIDTTIAILFLGVISALVGIYTGNIYLACFVILGGFAAIYGVKQYRDRTAILKAGLTIGVVNMIAAAALDQVIPMPTDMNVLAIKIVGGLIGGILASMFAAPLLPVLESIFNITTDIRLLELSNLDTPILRRLAMEAPGTYHHSIMMGTLAESAAEAIGANPLLVRVAAYYHDIGKISKPGYFVENQVYLQNKHETLSPHMSCLVLGSHVKEGLEMAEQLGLPNRIKDMIPQHHGTRVMTYFYQKAKTDPRNADKEIKETDFRYPGPKPQTKEAAILMITDSVEAASRTLQDPTPAQIRGMVKRLIDAIVEDGQLDECDITLKELDLIANSYFKVLCGMFHHRIEYPGYDFSKTEAESTPAAVANPSIQ